jgi:hypothetical protein
MKPMFGLVPSRDPTIHRRKTAELEKAEEERGAFLEEKKRLLEEQGIDLDAPTEQLGCPRCKTVYGFGDVCPTCQVELVGASAVETADPIEVEGPDRMWIFLYAIPGVIAVAMAVAIWLVVRGGGQ